MPDDDRRKWNAIHQERGFFPHSPSPHLDRSIEHLPPSGGAALDVAGGTGRHALWLTSHGFATTLADISATALRIGGEEAKERGVALRTIETDLEIDPFPSGPWDVILCFHFLHRPLFKDFARSLSTSGILIMVQPTVRNLERHSRPSTRFLVNENELPTLARESGLEICLHEEKWSIEDRHEAFMIARRKAHHAEFSGNDLEGSGVLT